MTQDPANIESAADEQEPPLSQLDEQLSAYLDGELPPDESRQVEQMLASDAAVRQRLQELQRTWDALDELDRTPVSERFTQSTLEIVTAAAVDEAEQTAAALPRLRRQRWWIAAALLAGCVVFGFAAVALFRPDPDRALLADLPVVARLDEYRYVGDVKFLKQLAAEGWFDEDRTSGDDGKEALLTPDVTVGESSRERRKLIEQLSETQKEELRRRWENFQSFDAAERQRLGKIQEQIDADAEAVRLRTTLAHYYDWLVSLPSFRRAELAEMESELRFDRVKAMLDEQAAEPMHRWQPQDLAVVTRWLEQYAARNDQEAVLHTLPPGPFRDHISKLSAADRNRVLVTTMILLAGRMPALSDQDLAELREKLSTKARERLGAKTPTEQRQIMAVAMRQAASGMVKSPWNMVDDSELAKYFESGMTAKQRERLFNLPADQWTQELRRMYLMQSKSGEVMEHWPERPGGFKRGGMFPPEGPYSGRKKKNDAPNMPPWSTTPGGTPPPHQPPPQQGKTP